MGKFRIRIFLTFSSILIFFWSQLKDLITYYIHITKYVYIACIHEIYCDQNLKNTTFYQNLNISRSVFFLIFSSISIFFWSQLIDLSKYYQYDTIHTYSMSIC